MLCSCYQRRAALVFPDAQFGTWCSHSEKRKRWRWGICSWLRFNCARAWLAQPKFRTCQKFIQPYHGRWGADKKTSLPSAHCLGGNAQWSEIWPDSNMSCMAQIWGQKRVKNIVCPAQFEWHIYAKKKLDNAWGTKLTRPIKYKLLKLCLPFEKNNRHYYSLEMRWRPFSTEHGSISFLNWIFCWLYCPTITWSALSWPTQTLF